MTTMLASVIALLFLVYPSMPKADEGDDSDFSDLLPPKESSPPDRKLVLSARICGRKIIKIHALSDIRNEYKYSKIGGVIHVASLSKLQEIVRYADMVIAKAKSDSRAEHIVLLRCSAPELAEFMKCANSKTYETKDCGPLGSAVQSDNQGLGGE